MDSGVSLELKFQSLFAVPAGANDLNSLSLCVLINIMEITSI